MATPSLAPTPDQLQDFTRNHGVAGEREHIVDDGAFTERGQRLTAYVPTRSTICTSRGYHAGDRV